MPEFINACQDFKTHKETVRGFQTLIVDTTQIYAEFDSAATREDNIRNFISYAGTFWREPKPKFFLLVGNVKAVPNFGTYIAVDTFYTDYYYGQSIYGNDFDSTDFYVGRIPAIDTIEIKNYFEKVINYESDQTIYDWMNNNLFLCQYSSIHFIDIAIGLSEDYLPPYTRTYIITDDDSSVYYGNTDSIYSAINERGASFVWFEGFSSDSSFISQDYFNLNDINGFTNYSKYFITIFPWYQGSIIDTNTNLTREMIVDQEAGSLGGNVLVDLTWWPTTANIQVYWAQRLFNPSISSIGEALTLDNPAYSLMRKVSNLWADPSLQLKYDVTVGVDEPNSPLTVQEFSLKQNFPNPFNPTTTIKYQVPVAGNVSIKIYNVLGKEISELVNENKNPGSYEVVFDAAKFPSGVYFYRIKSAGFVQTKKMILLR